MNFYKVVKYIFSVLFIGIVVLSIISGNENKQEVSQPVVQPGSKFNF